MQNLDSAAACETTQTTTLKGHVHNEPCGVGVYDTSSRTLNLASLFKLIKSTFSIHIPRSTSSSLPPESSAQPNCLLKTFNTTGLSLLETINFLPRLRQTFF